MKITLIAVIAATTMLQGCAQPFGPLVRVMPGQGKTYATFENDERVCSMHTNDIVQPMINSVATATIGTAAVGALLGVGVGAVLGGGRGAGIGAVSGTLLGGAVGSDPYQNGQDRIQRTYDNTYSACMASQGNQIEGPAPTVVMIQSAPVLMQPMPYYMQPQPVITVIQPATPGNTYRSARW